MKTEDGNEALHPWIEPELEARLTALVLGEASDFERDELERLVAERPELGLYRKRLEAMHRMLREVATGESTEEQGEWKLGAERRAAVLARLSGEVKAEEKVVVMRESKRHLPWRVIGRIAASFAVVGLVLSLILRSFTTVLGDAERPKNNGTAFATSDGHEMLLRSDRYSTVGHGGVGVSGRYGVPLDGSDLGKHQAAQTEWNHFYATAEKKSDVDRDSQELALADRAIRLPAPTSATPAPPAEPMVVDKPGQIGALNGTVAIGAGGAIALGIDPNSPGKVSVTNAGNGSANVRAGGSFDGGVVESPPAAEMPVTSTLGGENTYTGGTEIGAGGGALAITGPEPGASDKRGTVETTAGTVERQLAETTAEIRSLEREKEELEGAVTDARTERGRASAKSTLASTSTAFSAVEVPAIASDLSSVQGMKPASSMTMSGFESNGTGEAEDRGTPQQDGFGLVEGRKSSPYEFGTTDVTLGAPITEVNRDLLSPQLPAPAASPKPVAAAPVPGPAVTSEPVIEQQLMKQGAGNLALNGGVVEFDGFVDVERMKEAAKKAPTAGSELNFTGDFQKGGGAEAKGKVAMNGRFFGAGGTVGAVGEKNVDAYDFIAPAEADGLKWEYSEVEKQMADASRMVRLSEVDKSVQDILSLTPQVGRSQGIASGNRPADAGFGGAVRGGRGTSVSGSGTVSSLGLSGDEFLRQETPVSGSFGFENRPDEGNANSPRARFGDSPEGTPSANLFTTVYQVPPTFLAPPIDPANIGDPFANPVSAGASPAPGGRTTAKQILESAGISFPEGASAIYNAETSQLIVRNTPDQTELVEAFVDSVAGSDEKEGEHLFTRNFLGGANSLRGFDYRDVGQRSDVDKSVQDILALTPQVGKGLAQDKDKREMLYNVVPRIVGGGTESGTRIVDTESPEGKNGQFPSLDDVVMREGREKEKIRSAAFYDVGEITDGPAATNSDRGIGLKLFVQGNAPVRLDYGYPLGTEEDRFRFRVGATMDSEAQDKAGITLRQPTPAALDETAPTAEPFSTFSLHVSDVSFQLAKSSLASGKWPEAEKIRIEEFVNAFDYGDPVPSMGERVSCRIDQGAHPFLQQRNLVRIALRTAEAGRSSGTPLRLTLLLDSSGSMERPDRRATLTRAVATLAGLLGENDRITLVSFARQPRLVADAVAGNEAMKLAETVAALPSEGGTNLEAALELAFEKAREHQEANAQNRIVLLTDGAANLGDAKAESLGARVEMMRDAGIAFDAAGFGAEGLNDEILEALTRKGDGRYYLLDRPEDAGEAFAEQIAGALRPAAKNVKVQVEFNPDRVKSYKLLGFEKHRLATEDFRNDAVDAAELAAAEAGVAVYQVEPDPAGEGDLGSVSVRFRDLESGEMIERRWALPHLAAAPTPKQGGDEILLATVASQFAAKLAGGPVGDVVDLGELARLAAALPESPRVDELRTMIEQARGLEGDR